MNQKRKRLLSIFIIGLMTTQLVFAGWSRPAIFLVKPNAEFTRYTQDGTTSGANKETTSTEFWVDTYWRTMYTAPVVRLVNSNNQIRSNTVGCAAEGKRAIGNGNVGEVGYRYYASIRSSWTQVGNDTIKLDFTPR